MKDKVQDKFPLSKVNNKKEVDDKKDETDTAELDVEKRSEYNEQTVYKDETFGFSITELPDPETGLSLFTVYDDFGDMVTGSFEDITLSEEDKQIDNFKKTSVYKTYLDLIDKEYLGAGDSYDNYDNYYNDDYYFDHLNGSNKNSKIKNRDDDGSWMDYYDYPYPALGKYDYKKKEKTPEEIAAQKEKEKEKVESLCKSDTIVFHKEDSSTVMLNPIYEGKGWDVYKGTTYNDLSEESVYELIKRHDKIVCLGHGSPSGLFGGNIDKDAVPYLKDKKIFSMWCYAATFWKDNGFEGHGILTSDNFPSEVWECKAACDAVVDEKWIFDNMMLAGEIAGKAIDMSWTDPQGACDYFRKEYSEKSDIKTEDERKVVEFNTNSMQVV